MMPSFLGNPAVAPLPGYATDAFLDDLSRQIAASSRRLSRGSASQRPGGAMRIMKPSSANNSPRSALLQARRRTLMNDGNFNSRRNPHTLSDQASLSTPAHADLSQGMFTEASVRAARPVSWHPTSHLAQAQVHPQPIPQYPFPAYHDMELLTSFPQFPPTPAAYSGYTSPSSTFSPLSLPYSGFEAPGYFSTNNWAASAGTGPAMLPSPTDCQPLAELAAPPSAGSQHTASDSSAEWGAFVANGFDRCTAPPTPDSFPATEQPQPKVPAEETIPYEPLQDDESEGEILIGMGLYDPPEKEVTDPTLESYRSSVASLLGEAYKYPEPTGKGLKLEDAWEPPETDDEQDEDDDEQDAEADEQSNDI